MDITKNVINMSDTKMKTYTSHITHVCCKNCNSYIQSSSIKFKGDIYCNIWCLNNYISTNEGFTMNCPKCNKKFSKKTIGSHQMDIYNNIYVFCSHKCQFSYKK